MAPALHQEKSNVVPIRVQDAHAVRPRHDVTARLASLLHDADTFLTAYRLAPTGLEPVFGQDCDSNVEPASAEFLKALKARHRHSPVYAIEIMGSRLWGTIEPGEVLLVAPSCKLRTLGLCLVAFTDGRPPDIRVFAGRRQIPSGDVSILAPGGNGPIAIEPAKGIAAIHPVIGSLHPALIYDSSWGWTARMCDFTNAADSREKSFNTRWRFA